MCHLAVCWMKTEVVQVLTRCLGHYTTQLFHIARQILHSPDKTMRRTTCTAAVLPNMGCGRPEAHKLYCSHCCCPLWSNFSFFFFSFFIHFIRQCTWCFLLCLQIVWSQLLFLQICAPFLISQIYTSRCQFPACEQARQATSKLTIAA